MKAEKKKIANLRLVLLSAILALFVAAAEGEAFSVPETLVYDLTWTGIRTGVATLSIWNDKDLTRIVSTARAAGWVSVFYTVEDRIESTLLRGSVGPLGQPRDYRVRIHEGRLRRDKEVTFDARRGKAFFVDLRSGEKRDVAIKKDTFDPLSSLYYVRTLDFKVGSSLFVNVVDSRKLWRMEVQVIRKERVNTKLGGFDTILIKPMMKSEGIFNRRGDMYIWLTDDKRRIPVKMQTKVALGSVTAVLAGGSF